MAIPVSNLASALAKNATFKERVKFLMQKSASAVIGEATPTKNRHDYSVSVLNGSANIEQMSMAAVTNATISAAINMSLDDFGISDSDLEFTINSLWDDFSAKTGDVP